MLSNRRNLVFRVSIVINVLVLFYAAMHLSGTPPPSVEWLPVTGNGGAGEERVLDYRSIVSNESETRVAYNLVEFTSPKTPSTLAPTNKTTSSTTPSPAAAAAIKTSETTNYTEVDIINETMLSDATLARLKTLLQCHEKEFVHQKLQRGEFWVLKNYVRADHDHRNISCQETITYTTHASFEFLDNIVPLLERWQAPVSLAVHAPGSDFAPTLNSIRYLRDCIDNDMVRNYVTFHLFFSYKHIPSNIPDPINFLNSTYNCTDPPPYVVNSSTTYSRQKELLYPVNVARNVAREAALTHFVLPSDIELYPSPKLVPRFLNMIARNEKPLNTNTNPRVFPISIFEVDGKVSVPTTKTMLQKMLSKKTAIPFHKFVCPNCHGIPMGPHWIKAPETEQMDVFHVGKRRGTYVHWEPIFIGTHSDPYYDERLSWEGKQDKMTQGYILCVKDYDFMILNNAFLTHKPGIKHYVKNVKRENVARRQSTFIKNTIMPELKKLFGSRTGCAL